MPSSLDASSLADQAWKLDPTLISSPNSELDTTVRILAVRSSLLQPRDLHFNKPPFPFSFVFFPFPLFSFSIGQVSPNEGNIFTLSITATAGCSCTKTNTTISIMPLCKPPILVSPEHPGTSSAQATNDIRMQGSCICSRPFPFFPMRK